MKKNIKNDLIVFGATGFTGKLVVEYLIKNYGTKNQNLLGQLLEETKQNLKN